VWEVGKIALTLQSTFKIDYFLVYDKNGGRTTLFMAPPGGTSAHGHFSLMTNGGGGGAGAGSDTNSNCSSGLSSPSYAAAVSRSSSSASTATVTHSVKISAGRSLSPPLTNLYNGSFAVPKPPPLPHQTMIGR